MHKFLYISIMVSILFVSSAYSEWKVKSGGEVTLESRIFENDGEPKTYDQGLGAFMRLQGSFKNKSFQSSFRITSRVDSIDHDRNQIYFEEAWAGLKYSLINFKVGFQMFNWSATEAFHPADVMNSRNYDSNIENPDKIGEPTLSLGIKIFSGNITFFYMPYYQKSIMPGEKSRLNFIPVQPVWIRKGGNIYIDHTGKKSRDYFGQQGAVRFIQSFSDFDISLHAIYHTEKRVAIPGLDQARQRVYTIFPRVIEYGGTIQYAFGSFVLKSEAVYKQYFNMAKSVKYKYVNPMTSHSLKKIIDHPIVAVGLDYKFNVTNVVEATLFLEGQRIFSTNQSERENLDTFQSDVLFGVRFVINDALEKTFMFTSIIDTERRYQVLLNANYSQKISDDWGINAGVRIIMAKNHNYIVTGLEALDHANQLYLNISRYF